MNIAYRKTNLSKSGESFKIENFWHPKIDDWNPIYRDMLESFNYFKFTVPRPPISLGKVKENCFKKCPDVLRLPIKWGKSNEVKLPKELFPIKDEVIRLLQYDSFINPYFTDFFAHITIDNSLAEKGKTQRFPGFHGDGLQGGKFKNKLICEHSYIYVSNNPTEIALQPFFVAHLNENRVNIFKEFDRQVDTQKTYKTIAEHVYLIDPYVVHRSPVVLMNTQRTFFRLTLTPTELLMPKNTVNPMFDGQKYPERIDVRDFVSDPDSEIPYSFYGMDK